MSQMNMQDFRLDIKDYWELPDLAKRLEKFGYIVIPDVPQDFGDILMNPMNMLITLVRPYVTGEGINTVSIVRFIYGLRDVLVQVMSPDVNLAKREFALVRDELSSTQKPV